MLDAKYFIKKIKKNKKKYAIIHRFSVYHIMMQIKAAKYLEMSFL